MTRPSRSPGRDGQILLIGDRSDHGFAPLRTSHFAEAIGEGVRVVDWRDPALSQPTAVEATFGLPAAIVTASNHGPTRAALRVLAAWGPDGEGIPVWFDVAGDPFAEAQAAAAFSPRPSEIAGEATAVWGAALARGDAFSVVSSPGRHALLGALGLIGRLPLFEPGKEPVHVLPVAASFPDPPGAARTVGLKVALIGGFNTWFDEETLLIGLLRAMDRAPVRVTVYGGPIDGHHTAGFERFSSGIRASKHAGRFRLRGWIPHAELGPSLREANSTILLDRPGPEAELGGRTRVLYALHQGLRVIASTRAPGVAELAAAGLVCPTPAACEVGPDAAASAVADALLRPEGAPPRDRVDAWFALVSVERTTAALREWVASPRVAPRALQTSALAALSAERDALRAELAALRGSPSFRVIDRVRRKLPRSR